MLEATWSSASCPSPWHGVKLDVLSDSFPPEPFHQPTTTAPLTAARAAHRACARPVPAPGSAQARGPPPPGTANDGRRRARPSRAGRRCPGGMRGERGRLRAVRAARSLWGSRPRPASPSLAALPRGNFPIVRPLPAGSSRRWLRGAPRSGRRVVDGGGGGHGGEGVAVLGPATAAPRLLCSGRSGQAALAGSLRGSAGLSQVSRPLPECPGTLRGAARSCHRCPSILSPHGVSRIPPEQRGAVTGVPSPPGVSRSLRGCHRCPVPSRSVLDPSGRAPGCHRCPPIPSPPGVSRFRRGGRNAEFLCCVTLFVRGLERVCGCLC